MAKVGKRSKEVLGTVEPEFGRELERALRAAPDWLDFGFISGLREAPEQQVLFAKGRDEEGNVVDEGAVVTWRDGVIRLSRHQDRDGNGYGEAVDIAAFKGGRMIFDEYEVAIRAAYIVGFLAARSIEVEGGVRWDWDQGHLELVEQEG